MAQCIRKKKDGEQCRLNAMIGQTLCNKHGGRAPQNIAAAARRRQETEAQQALANRRVWNMDAVPTTDPVAELAALSGRIRDAVITVSSRAEIKDECVCCGVGEMDHATSLALRALIKESRSILTDMARLGIEDRRVTLLEEQHTMMIQLIRAALYAVLPEITEEQEILARETVKTKLLELYAAPRRTISSR